VSAARHEGSRGDRMLLGRMVVGVEVDGYCCFVLRAGDIDDDSTYRYVRSCERGA
jgi:hypothetical protein